MLKLQKTYSMKESELEPSWIKIDATGLVVGRLASVVAIRLMGKHKPEYTPSINCGDRVVIVNADKVCFSGKKMTDKRFYWHTGYPGGIRSVTMAELFAKKPEKVIENAVRRMLTRNNLGRKMMNNLYVYAGETERHSNHKMETLDVRTINPKNVFSNKK